MELYSINDQFLYILKVDVTGHYYTDCIQFNKIILDEVGYEEFKERITKEKDINEDKAAFELRILNNARNFLNSLYNNHNELFGLGVFCPQGALGSANCHFKSPNSLDEIKLKANYYYNSFSIDMEIIQEYSINAIVYFDYLFNLYFIRETQKLIKNDHNVKIFSHRELGFYSSNIPLNNDLSAVIMTNFGYGSASYFLLTIVYKGIKIIPYSRLVVYRYANKREFIRNTIEFELVDYSWFYGLNFIRDVCNDFIDKSNDSFVKKYFVDECEKLCNLLTQYLYTNKIKVSDYVYGEYYNEKEKIYEIQLEDDELCVFRAEKISGAIKFIDSLSRLNSLFDTTKYINTINNCCEAVLPMIEKSILNCKYRIQNNTKLDLSLMDLTNFLQNQCNELVNEIDNIDNYISQKKDKFNQKSDKVSSEDKIENYVNYLISNEFPNYYQLKKDYQRKKDYLYEKNNEQRNIKSQIYKDNENINLLVSYRDIILNYKEK